MEFQQIRKGSTKTLLLSLLAEDPMYGYQIARELKRRSDGYFEMQEGLLYPTLHQMEREGFLTSEWRMAGKRRRKYYEITSKGQRALAESVAQWRAFIQQFMRILGEGDVGPEDVPG